MKKSLRAHAATTVATVTAKVEQEPKPRIQLYIALLINKFQVQVQEVELMHIHNRSNRQNHLNLLSHTNKLITPIKKQMKNQIYNIELVNRKRLFSI